MWYSDIKECFIFNLVTEQLTFVFKTKTAEDSSIKRINSITLL